LAKVSGLEPVLCEERLPLVELGPIDSKLRSQRQWWF
jgi:hypothetical protein